MKRRTFLKLCLATVPTVYLNPLKLVFGDRVRCCTCSRLGPEDDALRESTGHVLCQTCMASGDWEVRCDGEVLSNVHTEV